MTKTSNTAVAVKKNTELTVSQVPEGIDFDADIKEMGANYSSDQMAMPFLQILQALSPQVTRGKAEFIPEAKVGELYNTVTKERYDGEKGINIVFAHFKDSYIEWVPRNEGGGFVAEYSMLEGSKIRVAIDPETNNRVIQEDSPYGTAGNHLNLTHTRLGFVVSDDLTRWTPVIISMTSSQIKVSNQLNTCHKLLEYKHPGTGELKKGPPLPFVIWTAKTKYTENNTKQSWFAWDIAFKTTLGDIPDGKGWNLYGDLRSFAKSTQAQNAMSAAAQKMGEQLADKSSSEEIPF